jgi:hypothetical protein
MSIYMYVYKFIKNAATNISLSTFQGDKFFSNSQFSKISIGTVTQQHILMQQKHRISLKKIGNSRIN